MTDIDLRRPPAERRAVRNPLEASPISTLEALADELAPPKPKTVVLRIPNRPAWSVEYDLAFDLAVLGGWRRASRTVGPDEIEEAAQALFEQTVLAAKCARMWNRGTVVTDDQGRPLTFASEDLWRLLHVPAGSPDGALEAVKAFYANPFDVTSAANKLLDDAGYGRPAEVDPDPTRPQ
jgi:hypothetical protein